MDRPHSKLNELHEDHNRQRSAKKYGNTTVYIQVIRVVSLFTKINMTYSQDGTQFHYAIKS
jgi:hypothetical protein